MSKITASSDIQQLSPDEVPRFIDVFAQDVTETINGKLDFATNFNAVTVTLTFPTANANTTFSHSLGRVPVGYAQVGQSTALVVYDGIVANTGSVLNLRTSAAGTVKLLIY